MILDTRGTAGVVEEVVPVVTDKYLPVLSRVSTLQSQGFSLAHNRSWHTP